ncbi:proline oxidase Put1, putative [Metarhizium acridum CQMa 102]|uniref:Proline dehydrogenase n=1 Tax=Metarhizium acridum (strain CQMa 102) TaxID=655827 RepID=E9E3N9_METAQ|nr:proline oxidase Put1, putative [Metarhizium acridum CQMa 102]EFY89464.1 proline oxidase Put1, putative [Metarhizium acridum CQMa 102]
MDFLTQPNRSFLFDINRNKLLAWIVRRVAYRHFCAGESGSEVRQTLKRFKTMGFRGTIVTYARETVFDCNKKDVQGVGIESFAGKATDLCPNIRSWRNGVLETIDMLGQGDQLAVKFTGAGPLVTDALAAGQPLPKQMSDALIAISDECKQRQVRLLIDAESQLYQHAIAKAGLDLMKLYNRDGHALIYSTYQAYLKSTPPAIESHLIAALEGKFTLGLKLVRGAYLATEKRSLIHDTKRDTDNAYNAIAHGALCKHIGSIGAEGGRPFPSVNLMLCGHNKESVFGSYALHQQRLLHGLPTVPLGFAQLQGMSDEISFGLLQLGQRQGPGPDVYKCSTWGTLKECLGYLTRRALENRDAAGRTVDEYRALKMEAKRRLRSLIPL